MFFAIYKLKTIIMYVGILFVHFVRVLLQICRFHFAVQAGRVTEVVQLLQSGIYVDCMNVSYVMVIINFV